jgi:uncharacterized membrane protein YGL010W
MGVIVGIVLMVVALMLDRIGIGMVAGGLTTSSLEIILLVSFQIIYGYLCQAIGLIVTTEHISQ